MLKFYGSVLKHYNNYPAILIAASYICNVDRWSARRLIEYNYLTINGLSMIYECFLAICIHINRYL